MKKLKSNLGNILKRKRISVHKLSVDLKHIRSTISSLAYNRYLINNRIPADLIVGICDYLDITVGELFEIVEFKEISLDELIELLADNESVDFLHSDNYYEICKNDCFDDEDMNPEHWSIIRDDIFMEDDYTFDQVMEWLGRHIEDVGIIWVEK